MKKPLLVIALIAIVISYGCTTQQKVVKVEPQVQQIQKNDQVLKRKVAIARFSNETQYAKGVFYDKDNDPVGKQALDILSTKLASTNKFILLERQDMITVDVTSVENVNIGDEVVLIGKQGDLEISVASFSESSEQINYELLTRLPFELPRYVVD